MSKSKNRITPSRLSLASKCLYWARPDVVWPKAESSPAMAEGIRLHGEIEAYLISRNRRDDSDIAGVYDWVDQNLKTTMLPEEVFVYNPFLDEARRPTAHERHKRSGSHPQEFFGIADVVHFVDGTWESPEIEIIDFKFGAKAKSYNKAKDHAQLLFYALAASRLWPKKRVTRIGVVFRDGTDDWHEIDTTDLDITREKAIVYHQSAPGATPRGGNWCFTCPMKTVCTGTPSWLKDKLNR